MSLQNSHCVAKLSELEDEVPFAVDVGGEELALILLNGDVYAINNVCTHEYACLSDGYVEDGRIVCPLHLAEFDIATGAVVEDPAEEDLKTYPVKIVDGEVYVQLD